MSGVVTTDYLDKKLDKFTVKIFKYMDKRFDEINEHIDGIEQNFDRLQKTPDAFVKRLDNIETYDAARDTQLARHERWIEQVAKKTGVKLEH